MRQFLEERAGACCEYCKANVVFSPNPFTIDHIIPKSAGGSDDPENLAYACFGCNRSKHDHTKAFDPFHKVRLPFTIQDEITGISILPGV
ncbi:MAG: HNH endonuclease [Saprospiraceae bacterium]|nr:HNH endonuclease [Saprospiraceae bacterium]